jgi:hypothetical protein
LLVIDVVVFHSCLYKKLKDIGKKCDSTHIKKLVDFIFKEVTATIQYEDNI